MVVLIPLVSRCTISLASKRVKLPTPGLLSKAVSVQHQQRIGLSSVATTLRTANTTFIMPIQQEETTNGSVENKITDVNTDIEEIIDIEELMHQAALQRGQTTYEDPQTGFTVFTELSHLKRGRCCGNKCRHCPYGYENVAPQNRSASMNRRIAKVKSGDRTTAKAMAAEILDRASAMGETSSTSVVDGAATTSSKNVPYTRKGDSGTSQLGTGERRSKDDCNFEALGTVDELCSVTGVIHAHLGTSNQKHKLEELQTRLLDIMSRLFDIGSHVAKPRERGTNFTANGLGDGFEIRHIDDLETWINEMTDALPELTSFILPTGAPAAAHLHVARTVCRRAERRMVPLVKDDLTCDPNAMKYLNRLSDFFFVAARWVNYCENQPEIQYQLSTMDTTQRERVPRSLHNEK